LIMRRVGSQRPQGHGDDRIEDYWNEAKQPKENRKMNAEMGEYLVGAYLEFVEECDFVAYNVRHPGEGLKALGEVDVLGLNFKKRTAYLCEVATHILGFLYRGSVGAEAYHQLADEIIKRGKRGKKWSEL